MKAQYLSRIVVCVRFLSFGILPFYSAVRNSGLVLYAFHTTPTPSDLTSTCRNVQSRNHSHSYTKLAAISKTTKNTDGNPDPPIILSQLHTYQKPRQERTSTRRPRKPRFYWQSHDNLRAELFRFWDELSVTIPSNQPPPIPSEYLLNHFHRNDLRWGISQIGGRENVVHILGGAKVIPGKWEQAIEFDEIKQLLPRIGDKQGSPMKKVRRNKQNSEGSMIQQSHDEQFNDGARGTQTIYTTNSSAQEKQINSTTTQTKEFWSKEKTVKNIYQYLESCRKSKQRPAVWMPQLAELSQEGYSKLFNACSRFKKLPYSHSVFASASSTAYNQNDRVSIHHVAGLVPFREWRYFESQLQLFVELEYYLTLNHNCSEEYFPEPADVLSNGHQRLYDLIRIHGGKTMLAQKLDMKYAWEAGSGAVVYTTHCMQRSSLVAHQGAPIPKSNRSWGPFSLSFAVKLLQFIRSQYLLLNPPLSCAHISMPCESDLIRGGYDELASQVILFGGYENVARKLGLQFFDEKSQWMDERSFRVAKMLWKYRMNENFTTFDGSARNSTLGKTKGVPWNEDIVVKELLSYTQVNMTKWSLPHFVMPRFHQLDKDGRDDLRRAISKFGGSKYISDKANLISIERWQKSS